MKRTVKLGPNQPLISPNPRKGTVVTSDQFSAEFEVEVELDGCYVIEFVLKEHRTLFADDVILSSRSASAQPYCLHAGQKQNFRVSTPDPGPLPSQPVAVPPGTIDLDPVSGHWPSHSSSTAAFYCEIEVYRVADCPSSTPLPCVPFPRARLGTINKHVTYSGEQTPVERELAAVRPFAEAPDGALPAANIFAALERTREPEIGLSAPVSVTAPPHVHFELRRCINDGTFGEHGVIVSRFETGPHGRRLSARVTLRDTYASLHDLGRDLAVCDTVARELNAGRQDGLQRGFFADRGIIRHGRATWFDHEHGPVTTFFFENQGFNVVYRGMGPSGAAFLRDVAARASPVLAEEAPTPEDVSVAFPDDWGTGIHLFAPIANIFCKIAFKYEHSISEMISEVFDRMIAANECIKRLRIHSHGGTIGDDSVTRGSFIRMGENDLNSTDLNADGTVKAPDPAQSAKNAEDRRQAANLVARLKAVMCHPSEIVFDACDQGVGELLQNLSKALGPDRTVKGYAGTGVPWGEGDRSYTNGKAN